MIWFVVLLLLLSALLAAFAWLMDLGARRRDRGAS